MNRTTSLSTIQNLMKEYDLFPRKKWGQNFLVDRNIVDKIVIAAGINIDDYVVEIGPGLGALTQQLAERSRGVLSIDIDENLKNPLNSILSDYDNTRLLFADILTVDIEAQLKDVFGLSKIPSYKVCANIPYNITSPIIFKLLENCTKMESATLMMQKEVAERILASPGGKDYGLLTLMVAYYSEVEFLMHVSHNCFYPRPEVDSSVIKISPLPEKRVKVRDEELFKQLVKGAFQKRRKTILNIASTFFAYDKKEIEKVLNVIGIEPTGRPETLTIEDFARLANAFTK